MDEYISKQAFKEKYLCCGWLPEMSEEEFNSFPAAGVVPVVRCRDCKWFNHYTMECESDDVATDHEGGASFSINFGLDDFCSYGQRKEIDHE